MNTVGTNIQRFRRKQGFSQEAMATELQVTRQTISSWETGKAFPDIDTLKRVAETLNTDVNDIIYDAAERKGKRLITTVSMKPVLLTPILFFLFVTWLGAIIYIPLFSNTIGGGAQETFFYPLYFGQIVLATLLVLCTCIIVDEVRRHGRHDDSE